MRASREQRRNPRQWRPVRRLALGLVAVVLVTALGAGGMWAAQRRLLYFPDGASPSAALLPDGWEPVSYPTSDGLTLDAWYRPPEPGQGVVIVFNGNAGNRGGRVPFGEGLAASGMGVLLTDYRGYGGNPGHPSEDGLANDARAALAFIRQAAPGSSIVYFGESLGAAVAVELASHEPPAALVLRSPFTSLADVGRVHYPWLPVGRFLKDRYPSLDRIGTIDVPLLVVAGDADSIIPVEQSRDLYAAANDPKRLVVIPGVDHNDPSLTYGREVIEAVVAFITGVD